MRSTRVKICRLCGRKWTARSRMCSCGGKLVHNLEASMKARRDLARKQQAELQTEIQQIDAEIKALQEQETAVVGGEQ